MVSILQEITQLRNGRSVVVDRNNRNRYRIVTNEPDGTKTAYYFSVPIYNIITRKAVDLKFCKKDDSIQLVGSNANINISNLICMENSHGTCQISLNSQLTYASELEVRYGKTILRPTTNGVFFKTVGPTTFTIQVASPFLKIQATEKYLAFMQNKYQPFVTVSCIGASNGSDEVTTPALIKYQILDECQCAVTVSPADPNNNCLMFEINLYEEKLVQDTTVESGNPRKNNVFGGTAFIGTTKCFGNQWLYSRFDFSKLSDLADRHIIQAVMHFPKYNQNKTILRAFNVLARFCSFGSNWDNKVATAGFISDSVYSHHYQNLDFTRLLADKSTGKLIQSEGIVLFSPFVGNFSVISTGDSHYKPQILEINFK